MNAPSVDDLIALRSEIEEIARSTQQIPAEADAAPSATSYSFSITSLAEEKIVAIVESIKQTLASLAPVAHFETTADGFTAKTVINYTGSAASVWSAGTTAKLMDEHLDSLQQAYAFCAAVTAVVATIGNAIVAISIAIGNPLTVWHAVKSAEALNSAVDHLAAVVAAQASTALS